MREYEYIVNQSYSLHVCMGLPGENWLGNIYLHLQMNKNIWYSTLEVFNEIRKVSKEIGAKGHVL